MDTQKFLSEFGNIMLATGGLQRLRELILQLAVSGRLVERNQNEESVESALLEAKLLKTQFEKDLEIGKTRLYPALRENEYPYEIPKHWKWERLENISCYIQRGKQPNYVNSGITIVVSQKCIQWTGLNLSVARYVDEASLSNYGEERFLQPGDLLWNSTGTGTVGRVAIYDTRKTVKAVADSHVTIIRLSNFLPRYVWAVLASTWIQVKMVPDNKNSLVTGTTKQVELSTNSVKALAIPCPPIAEQQRIIAKVDELLLLCDKLESQQKERATLRRITRSNLLNSLSRAETISDLRTSWHRLESNIHLLLQEPEDTEQFKIILLELAISGKMNTRESNVSFETFERMKARKHSLVKNKLIKRDTPVINFSRVQDLRVDIPKTWIWCRLNDIASVVRGGSPRPAGDPKFYDGNIPFLKVTDITQTRGIFVEDFTSTIKEEGLSKTREITQRTVLLSNSGATLGIPAICTFRATFNDGIAAFIELDEEVFDEYLYFYLKAKSKWMLDIASRGQGQPNLNTDIIRAMWFPLPPMAEQKAIVSIAKRMLEHCDQLTTKQEIARNTAELLASSAISSITGIQVEDIEKMKVPKTELVSTLRIGVSPANSKYAPLAAILIRNNGEISAKTLWQASGLEIDAFYQQLKVEVARGWIVQPQVAYMREVEAS
jgi:type I restriction enzyme, S subunit